MYFPQLNLIIHVNNLLHYMRPNLCSKYFKLFVTSLYENKVDTQKLL